MTFIPMRMCRVPERTSSNIGIATSELRDPGDATKLDSNLIVSYTSMEHRY